VCYTGDDYKLCVHNCQCVYHSIYLVVHNLPSVTPDNSVAVVVTSVLLTTGVSSVVLVYSCDDSVVILVSVSSAEDNDVKTLTVSSEISVVAPILDMEISVAYDELSVVYAEIPVVSVLECTLGSVLELELSDVLSIVPDVLSIVPDVCSIVPDSVVAEKSELTLVCIISPEPLSSMESGSNSPLMSGCVLSILPMPEPVRVLITSVFRSV